MDYEIGMDMSDEKIISDIDKQVADKRVNINQLENEIRTLLDKRSELSGEVPSPEPAPAPIASAPPMSEITPQELVSVTPVHEPLLVQAIDDSYREHGTLPYPEDQGYKGEFEGRVFDKSIVTKPPPLWGNKLWRETLEDPIKIWKSIDKRILPDHAEPTTVGKGAVYSPANFGHPEPYNTEYLKCWEDTDELPKDYDEYGKGFLVQIVNKYCNCLDGSSPARGRPYPQGLVGVIAGKHLLQILQKLTALDRLGRRGGLPQVYLWGGNVLILCSTRVSLVQRQI